MNIDHLIKMANEIGSFFTGESPEQAPQLIAAHMRRYWEPRMRREIVGHYNKGGGGLSDAAHAAVAILAAEAASSAPNPSTARSSG